MTARLIACTAAALLTISSLASCSSSRGPRASVQNSSSDYVTSMEIAAVGATNAYDLINRLRPRWLRTTAPSVFRTER